MKIIVITTAAFFISFAAAAQSPAHQKGDSTSQAPYENKDDILYRRLDNATVVSADDLPRELRSALDHPQYKGWEKSEITRSDDGKIYELSLGKGDKAKTYRFDGKGKPIKN
jgi:hypothetical protein